MCITGSKESLATDAPITSPDVSAKPIVDSTDGKSVEINLKTSANDDKDELFDRMEAIEKGTDIEEPISSSNSDKKEENHQNGDCSDDTDMKSDGISSSNQSESDKMDQMTEDKLLAENGDGVTTSHKRRLSSDSDNEVQMNKKQHTEDVSSSNEVTMKEPACEEVSGSNDQVETHSVDGTACDTSNKVTNGDDEKESAKDKDEPDKDPKIDGNLVEIASYLSR